MDMQEVFFFFDQKPRKSDSFTCGEEGWFILQSPKGESAMVRSRVDIVEFFLLV